jgi:hypothetical protein
VINTELEDVQHALQVQFTRIAQLQEMLDELKRSIVED